MEAIDSAGTRPRGVTPVDLLVAGTVLVLSVTTAAFSATEHGEPPFTLAAFGVLVAGAVALIWRRTYPTATLLSVGLAAAVYGVVDWPDPLVPFAVIVALAAVFEYSEATIRWAAWTLAVVVAIVGTALVQDSDALDWWTATMVLVAGPLVGVHLRTRRHLLEETTARLARLEAERLHALDDARAAERTRVARELHDVVAHHVTLLVVQAEAAASQPALAGTATQSTFDNLARSGRAAMTELRRLLGVLRAGESPLLTAPQPTLRDLHALVSNIEASGITVSTRIEGDLGVLPVAVDLAAYRIAQEALTNVVKHAPGSEVDLTVTRAERDLEVRITNSPTDAGTVPPPRSADGVGLIGLQERVGLLGGTLAAGPRPLGGFELRARLPLDLT